MVIKSRMMRLTGHVTRMGGRRNAYKTFVLKPERKRPLGRPRRSLNVILNWILETEDVSS